MTTLKITASDINTLRKQTGAGMMDCKKALTEANGDFEKAIELLRKKGQKLAAKRSDREAAEGVVIARSNADSTQGIIICLNCETDFVAKNDDFVGFAEQIADIALKNQPSTLEDLKKLPFDDKVSIEEKILENITKIGEKVELSGYEKIESETVYAYIHPGNRVGSVVGVTKSNEAAQAVAKDLALQVAAMAPIALDKDGVPDDMIQKEIEIGKEQARAEGKPEQILEKIAMGKLNKFYGEVTLLNQAFINDGKKTVKQYLQEIDKDLTVKGFKRFSLS